MGGQTPPITINALAFRRNKTMNLQPKSCLYCARDSAAVPLIAFIFDGNEMWICPQHLPILIHQPGKLADKLPGAENFQPAEGH
jgi:hypothetical protein